MGLILSPIVWGHVWLSGRGAGVAPGFEWVEAGDAVQHPRETDLVPKSAMPGLRHAALVHAASSHTRAKTSPWGNVEV